MVAYEVIGGKTPNERLFPVIMFAFSISIIEACGQYIIKDSQIKNNPYEVLFGAMFYIVLCFVLYKAYFYENVGHMNMVWSCMSIIVAYLVGHCFYNEDINRWSILSIILACIAIYTAHRADEMNRF